MTTPHQPDGGPATMTPAELLKAYDDLMQSRAILDKRERDAVEWLLCAAIFAAAAYEFVDDQDAAIIALLRAFLLALVDPMHPDLDYLRRDPAAAKAAREGGAT